MIDCLYYKINVSYGNNTSSNYPVCYLFSFGNGIIWCSIGANMPNTFTNQVVTVCKQLDFNDSCLNLWGSTRQFVGIAFLNVNNAACIHNSACINCVRLHQEWFDYKVKCIN